MNIKILLYNWKIKFNQEDIIGSCQFMEREISFQSFKSHKDNKDYIKHIIKHEITHALLFELGQSQNVFSNGKRSDSFDSEFICEFMSIYGEYITELTSKVYNKVLSIINK